MFDTTRRGTVDIGPSYCRYRQTTFPLEANHISVIGKPYFRYRQTTFPLKANHISVIGKLLTTTELLGPPPSPAVAAVTLDSARNQLVAAGIRRSTPQNEKEKKASARGCRDAKPAVARNLPQCDRRHRRQTGFFYDDSWRLALQRDD